MNIENIQFILSLAFVQRALIVGLIISISTALLGSVLVYKRLALIGDGLAHIGFGAVSLALALSWSPLSFTIPTMIIAAILIVLVGERKGIHTDAFIGIISNSALAFGIIVATLTSGFNVDVASYLFGSILALTHTDLMISLVLGIGVITTIILLHNRIFLITYDEELAKIRGLNIRLYKIIIAILTGLTVAIGMRLTGSLLISSLIIFPVTIANRFTKSYRTLVILASIIATMTFYLGIILSFILQIPSGAAIILFNVIVFSLSSLLPKS